MAADRADALAQPSASSIELVGASAEVAASGDAVAQDARSQPVAYDTASENDQVPTAVHAPCHTM